MTKKGVDWFILAPVLLLTSIGLIMVLSSSAAVASANYGNPYYFFKKQVMWAGVGLVALIFAANYRYHGLKKAVGLAAVVTFVFLIVILLPGVTDARKGATSWLRLGPLSFQPSELVKLCTVLILAKVLTNKRNKLDSFREGLLPPILITGAICLLIILQRDLGVTMSLAFTAFTMFFLAGARLYHLVGIAFTGVAAAGLAVLVAPYRFTRVTTFLDPWSDPLGPGYQIIQSLYAIGSGGLFGVGLGNGKQKFLWIPESHTDFIYSVLAEEMGFLGGIFIIILFIILIGRGLRIAFKTEDSFGSLMAAGITTIIAVEAIMNIAVATDSMPVTGITLPFVSYGGSSLLFKMVSVGILMNISSHCRDENIEEKTSKTVSVYDN